MWYYVFKIFSPQPHVKLYVCIRYIHVMGTTTANALVKCIMHAGLLKVELDRPKIKIKRSKKIPSKSSKLKHEELHVEEDLATRETLGWKIKLLTAPYPC